MATVAGLFHDRDEAMRGLDALRTAGFGVREVMIVATPTSAGIAASDVLLRVQVVEPERASLAHAILEDAGAERVGPGLIRD